MTEALERGSQNLRKGLGNAGEVNAYGHKRPIPTTYPEDLL